MRYWICRKCWSDYLFLRIAWAASRLSLVFSMRIFSSSEPRSNLPRTLYLRGAVASGTIPLVNFFWFASRLTVLRRWTICFMSPLSPGESWWVRTGSTRPNETGYHLSMNCTPSSAWVTTNSPRFIFVEGKVGRFYLFEKLGVLFRDQVSKMTKPTLCIKPQWVIS